MSTGPTPTVAVLGGGIGGLSAAQELGERGFDVAVYEANERFGGKARSIPAAFDGGPTLPGEHGFRFFPGFYWHVTDTMARIPDGDGSVADNLVPTTETLIGSVADGPTTTSTRTPRTPGEWVERLKPGVAAEGVPGSEAGFFLERLLVLATSCEARLDDAFDDVTWWEFIDADEFSEAYRKNLGRSTQLLVALDPKRASARTVGRIYIQLLRGMFDPSLDAERILSGPTSEAWIDPWTDYLDSLGIEFHRENRVERIACDGRRVTGVTVEADGETEIEADYYVAALPVEVMAGLVTDDLVRGAPSLAGVEKLDTAWMNGIQFFLREDVPLANGHQIYPDSPWALTSISQQQFWDSYDLRERTDGEVGGVLSVIVSDWTTPGVVHGKPAKECSPEEIREEVWTQLTDHLDAEHEGLTEKNVVEWALDPALRPTDGGMANDEPLLVNTVGSLAHRPAADTDIENLTLAADYVHTNTDLACMEGANEAARRATNAIVERSGMAAERCEVRDLAEPKFFEPLKRQDEIRYRLGLPHPGEARKSASRLVRRLRPRV